MERRSFKEYQDAIDELNIEMKNTSFLRVLDRIGIWKEIRYLGSYLEDVYVNSFEFGNLNNIYMEVINNVASLLKSLGIVDPVDIFTVYSYLIRNGFLSYNHKFVYNKNADDGIYLLGSNVVSGEGVCRHICSFLTDIYQNMGYVSCNICMVSNKNLESMERKKYKCVKSKKESTIRKYVDDFCYSFFNGSAPYNHLVTLVKDYNGTLILDPTNDIAFFVNNKKKVLPVIEKDICMECDYMSLFNNNVNYHFSNFLMTTNLGVVNNVLSKYNDTWDFCEKYSGLFEYFYYDNYDLYKDVVNKRKILIKEFKRNMG